MRQIWLLGLLSLLACTRRDLVPSVMMLSHSDTLWLATSEIDTTKPWIGRVGDLVSLPGSGTILVRDAALNVASEVAPDGTILYQYAPRKGSGPGEIQRLSDIFANGTSVFLFDNRTRRILRYSLRGSLQNEIVLEHGYAAVASMGDSAIIAVPGSGNSAFDVYSVTGEFLGSHGLASDLPHVCVDGNCKALPICALCDLLSLTDKSILVTEPTTPSIVRFDSVGHRMEVIRFDSIPFVHDWWVEAQRDIASHADERPPNAIETKTFFGSVAALADKEVVIPVLPPRRVLKERGRELWFFDLSRHQLTRYSYPATSIGQFAAVNPATATIFAANPEGSTIESFPLPSPNVGVEEK